MADSCSSSIIQRARAFRDELGSLDLSALAAEECALLVKELALAEKACATAKVVAAARATAGRVHRAEGFANAATWLARESGSSIGEARTVLKTAATLDECPGTRQALTAGRLSFDQAREITQAERARPGCEHDLLEVAGRSGLWTLRERARRERREEVGPDELRRRQQRARTFRHWRTELGMVGIAGELPPDVGLPIVNRLDAERDRLRRTAQRSAHRLGEEPLPTRAYAADALVQQLAGRRKQRSPDLVVAIGDVGRDLTQKVDTTLKPSTARHRRRRSRWFWVYRRDKANRPRRHWRSGLLGLRRRRRAHSSGKDPP